MKKTRLIAITCASIFSIVFTGCEKPPYYPDYDEKLQTLYTNKTSEDEEYGDGYKDTVLMFKYNFSNQIIDYTETGYVQETDAETEEESDRKIISEISKNVKDINSSMNFNRDDSSMIKMRQFEKELFESTKKPNNSRAASLFKAGNAGNDPDPNSLYLLNNMDKMTQTYKELEKLYDGKHCIVYKSNLGSPYYQQNINDKIDKNVAKRFGDNFDKYFDLETKYLGSNEHKILAGSESPFITTPDKIKIVIFDINCDAAPDQTGGIQGYFFSLDLYNAQYLDNHNETLKSNESQIIYFDGYFLSIIEKYMYSTLVHEFNHLLNFVNKSINCGSYCEEWYTEMLSMCAEDMFINIIGISEEDIPNRPLSRLPLFSLYYNYGFKLWEYPKNYININPDFVYIPYANTFAYGAFLMRNYGGFELIKKLANHRNGNEEAITSCLKEIGYSETFKDTVYNFYKAILNTSTEGQTLNKEIAKNDDGMEFTPIDLTKILYNLNNTKDWYDCYPTIFYANYKGSCDLGPLGCSIHLVGANPSYILFRKPDTPDVEIYMIDGYKTSEN